MLLSSRFIFPRSTRSSLSTTNLVFRQDGHVSGSWTQEPKDLSGTWGRKYSLSVAGYPILAASCAARMGILTFPAQLPPWYKDTNVPTQESLLAERGSPTEAVRHLQAAHHR